MQHEAYIAGFIDGEGTIRLHSPARASQYVPMVRITSVTPDVLNYVQSIYGGWIRDYQPTSSKGKQNCRTAYEWTIQGRETVLKLMMDIAPYCIVKAAHVQLMVRFITEGEKSAPPKPVSDEEVARRKDIFEQFATLNKRGTT